MIVGFIVDGCATVMIAHSTRSDHHENNRNRTQKVPDVSG